MAASCPALYMRGEAIVVMPALRTRCRRCLVYNTTSGRRRANERSSEGGDTASGFFTEIAPVASLLKGPYIKDVRKIFGFFDPLPPLSEFFIDLYY